MGYRDGDVKVLKAKITGWSRGAQVDERYRAVLYRYKSNNPDFNDRLGIRIEEEIKGTWHGCPSGWLLETLLGLDGFARGASDRIALDYGQQWYVTGMLEALKEAVNHG